MEIDPMLFWNIVLTMVIAPVFWAFRQMFTEVKRLQILLVGTLLGLITSLISVTIWYFGLRPLKEKKSIS